MTVFLATLALFAVVMMIAIEIALLTRKQRPPRRVFHRHARRQPLLEDRLRDTLVGPRAQYGEIFTSYTIWKQGHETRMELSTGDPWLRLNEFTRALVVRHIWRTLERLSRGSVVVVDTPSQNWSAEIDKTFDDQGIDPWGEAGHRGGATASGPQFVKGP